MGLYLFLAIRVIQASVNEGGREPCLQDSERTEHNNGESSKENYFKNSAGKPSGPGYLPDCIEERDSAISAWDIGSSNLFLRSGERLGILRPFQKYFFSKFKTEIISIFHSGYS